MSIKEIEDWVAGQIQEKIDRGILDLTIDTFDDEKCKHELEVYKTGLIEGMVNGILMMGGLIEDLEFKDVNEIRKYANESGKD